MHALLQGSVWLRCALKAVHFEKLVFVNAAFNAAAAGRPGASSLSLGALWLVAQGPWVHRLTQVWGVRRPHAPDTNAKSSVSATSSCWLWRKALLEHLAPRPVDSMAHYGHIFVLVLA